MTDEWVASIDPTDAQTKGDLAEYMRMLRVRADNPSYRDLERRALKLGKGRSLPRTTLSEVLLGRRFPSKIFLLTFVELCGVDPAEDRRWEITWNRLAAAYSTKTGGAGIGRQNMVSHSGLAEAGTHPAKAGGGPERPHPPTDPTGRARAHAQLDAALERWRLQTEAVRKVTADWQRLAESLTAEGQWALAEQALRATLELQSRTFDDHDVAALSLRQQLAVIIGAQGRHLEAETILRTLLRDLVRMLGPEHPETESCRHALVLVANSAKSSGGSEPPARHAPENAPRLEPRAVLPALRGDPLPGTTAELTEPAGLYAGNERVDGHRSHPLPEGFLPPVWNVEARNPEFTGRDAIVRGLRERLASGGSAVVQALRGLGGVGKTQIAIEYAHRYAGEYTAVWWIAAEDPELIGDQMAALAEELQLVERGEATVTAAAIVKTHLRGRDRWLLIFDNAEQPAAVRRWLPGGPGHVLITSRVGGWEHVASVLALDVMGREESIALLRTHHPTLGTKEAVPLAEALGDLPLALAQAGGFLAETATGVDDYLSLLEEHPFAVLSEGTTGDHPHSLAAVIGLGIDRLSRVDKTGLALVRLCAFLAPEKVPVKWLADWHGGGVPPAYADEEFGDSLALRRGVAAMGRLGLATTTREGLRLHRLVQGVIRDRLPVAERAKIRDDACALLVANSPGDPEDPSTWPDWAKLLPHLLAVDPSKSATADLRELACNAAWYLIERGDVDAAERLAGELWQTWRTVLGPTDFHTLWAARDLARAMREQGRYEQAHKLYEDTLPLSREVLPEDHPHTLRLAHGFAINLHLLGEYEQARQLQQDTWMRYRKVLGEDHAHTLHSANHLAAAMHALGRHDDARSLHEDTLRRYQRELGDDHPDTLRSANNLAVDLRALGQYERARELQEDTLERRRQVLGDSHPHTLQSATSLAETLHAMRRNEDARVVQEQALLSSRLVLGEDHPETVRAALTLADVMATLGESGRADELRREVAMLRPAGGARRAAAAPSEPARLIDGSEPG